MQNDHKNAANQLFRAILSLRNIRECQDFFEDAFTIREMQEISQRFEVARMLWEGNSYNEVNRQTGASTATICRVKKCLTDDDSGYRLVLERMQIQEATE